MKYKVLFTDIDGTLMCPERKFLTKQCKDMLTGLQENGILVIPTTGRGFKAIRPEILGGIRADYSICNNGACVLNREGKILYSHPMTKEQMELLCKLASEHDYSLGFSFSDGYYSYYNDSIFREFYRVNNGDMECMIEGCDHKRHLTDMPFSGWGMVPISHAQEFNRQDNGLVMIPFKDISHDICQLGINKKTGADFLLEYLGIDWKDTVAVGDGFNDLEILRAAGIRIVMDNAPDALKACADIITDDVKEDGATAAIKKVFLSLT